MGKGVKMNQKNGQRYVPYFQLHLMQILINLYSILFKHFFYLL